MPGAQIVDVTSFMPERIVPVRDDLIGEDSPFYHGVRERRARHRGAERIGADPEDVSQTNGGRAAHRKVR